MEVLGEDVTVSATIGEGKSAREIGAIIRVMPKEPAVPGFALFSSTTERLPHIKELPGPLRARVVDAGEARVPAADALAILMQKNPGLSKEDAFVRLLGEPVLDVVVGLYAQGASLELHPQNFMFHFDPKTSLTDKIVVRDLHGMNYNAEWRKQRGLDDVFTSKALEKAFPGITQAGILQHFQRAGALRDRYQAPGMFQTTLDFFSAMFFYHMLDSLHAGGHFTRDEVDDGQDSYRHSLVGALIAVVGSALAISAFGLGPALLYLGPGLALLSAVAVARCLRTEYVDE
jgi:hypothetical protein